MITNRFKTVGNQSNTFESSDCSINMLIRC